MTFTGELKLHKNKIIYRDYEGDPVYFGPPSPEIDANWDALLKGSGLDLSGADADAVKDWTFEEPQGGLWRTEYGLPKQLISIPMSSRGVWMSDSQEMIRLDVFHQLHCLNLVRKSLDLDYYYQDGPQPPLPTTSRYSPPFHLPLSHSSITCQTEPSTNT